MMQLNIICISKNMINSIKLNLNITFLIFDVSYFKIVYKNYTIIFL